MHQVLNRKGELVGDSYLTHADDQLLALYEKMVLTRILDRKLAAMNLQGRIGSYYKMEGQEAHIGAVMAMGEGDFLFPAYREMGMWLDCGLPLDSVVRLRIGQRALRTLSD